MQVMCLRKASTFPSRTVQRFGITYRVRMTTIARSVCMILGTRASVPVAPWIPAILYRVQQTEGSRLQYKNGSHFCMPIDFSNRRQGGKTITDYEESFEE